MNCLRASFWIIHTTNPLELHSREVDPILDIATLHQLKTRCISRWYSLLRIMRSVRMVSARVSPAPSDSEVMEVAVELTLHQGTRGVLV
jgi:hypothetical protein